VVDLEAPIDRSASRKLRPLLGELHFLPIVGLTIIGIYETVIGTNSLGGLFVARMFDLFRGRCAPIGGGMCPAAPIPPFFVQRRLRADME
jgi:hypothetical protein